MIRTSFCLLVLACASIMAHAQLGLKPVVGKPMPDFTLNDITHYKVRNASLKDFRGKWLFLDFWYSGCVACIKSFPKISSYKRQFGDEAEFVMIGVNIKRYGDAAQLYEKLQEKQNLLMASAYDSVLFERWDIHSMPHIIIIDPGGIVKAITGGQDITSEKVKDLLKGKDVELYPKDIIREDFVGTEANLNEISSDDLFYSSLLTKWSGENQHVSDINVFVNRSSEYLKKGFRNAMVPLYSLYNQAYFGCWHWSSVSDSLYGKVYPTPVLELRDSSLFQFSYQDAAGPGLYNYSLIIPVSKMKSSYLKAVMQQELRIIFGYEVSIESREMPVWQLVLMPGSARKLATKGEDSFMSDGRLAGGFSARNLSIDKFLGIITSYISDFQPPFIDETHIDYNIDIVMEADMTNFEDVRKCLRKNGMDLIKGKKEMKVMVLRDPK